MVIKMFRTARSVSWKQVHGTNGQPCKEIITRRTASDFCLPQSFMRLVNISDARPDDISGVEEVLTVWLLHICLTGLQ